VSALIEQGIEGSVLVVDKAKSLNPYNVNRTINELRSKGLESETLFSGLRKIALAKDKPATAAAYKELTTAVRAAKEGVEAGREADEDSRNARLRLLLGVLKAGQGNPELGLIVTGAEFAESFAYLGFLSGQVTQLSEITDTKLVRLNTLVERLKEDVAALRQAKKDLASANQDEPQCL
jgi:hypothetical protein